MGEILDALYAENEASFKTLQSFVSSGEVTRRGTTSSLGDTTVEVHYIPGNHDRLLNAWASTRKKARKMLGMPDGSSSFRYTLTEGSVEDEYPYGLLIRHGQEYDKHNFSLPPAEERWQSAPIDEYLAPCLGDYVTIDIATRLALAFKAFNAVKLRADTDEGKRLRKLYQALTEFDDVRPISLLITYLKEQFGSGNKAVFAALRAVLRDAYEAACENTFFTDEAKRLGLGKHFGGARKAAYLAAIKHLDGDTLADFIEFIPSFESGEAASPAGLAQHEIGVEDGSTRLVIAGHTHDPERVPLPCSVEDTEPVYINTGTWRTRIPCGVADTFGRLRTYTMVFCYAEIERKGFGDKRVFESWTGHLSGDEFGPYEKELQAGGTSLPTQILRFLKCRVENIDEGDNWIGTAELELHFGVDADGLTLTQSKVENSDLIEFGSAYEVELDPRLDGELWAWGVEKDFGDSILDSDDPLPWVLRRLPRNPNNSFTAGKKTIRLKDHSGAILYLDYEIEPAQPSGSDTGVSSDTATTGA